MAFLSRESILEANDVAREEVEVPEWGGSVLVQAMNGTDRDKLESSMVGKNNKPELNNFRAKLVAASVVDENGDRIFSESDISALGKKSASALDRVADVAQRVSALSDQDVDELQGN